MLPTSPNEGCRGLERASERLKKYFGQYRSGWSLPGDFYSDQEIYRLDLEAVWRRGWLFAGHSCEIPGPGDYLTLAMDTDPLLMVRGEDGVVRGFYNVCRHRGSIICAQRSGHVSRLVCPYHQWTYGLDGRLLSCRGMQEDLPKSEFSLGTISVREVEGLIFLSLAEEPFEFAAAEQELRPFLRPQGLSRAKVAAWRDYAVNANWKIVWENNRECFHCNANHPQYIKANFDHYNADEITPRIRQEITAAVERSERKWAAAGLAVNRKEPGMTIFPDARKQVWHSVNRTPLAEGYASESMNGKQVAPLMGDYREADVGTLRIRTIPNFWNHSSCDHSVSTRLLPGGPQLTLIRVYWLVDQMAVEGRDYELSRLLPFWQRTSEQDWEICENQQRGTNSRAYRPGPYSALKEYNVNSFDQWYLQMLRGSMKK